MPHPDENGRHPWVERYAPRYSAHPWPPRDPRWDWPDWPDMGYPRRRSTFYELMRDRRGEPARFWDEEYYPDNPGPWLPTMLDELDNDTARGYRFSFIDPPRIDFRKGIRL